MSNKALIAGIIAVLVVIGGVIYFTTKGPTQEKETTTTQPTPSAVATPMEEATDGARTQVEDAMEGAVKEFTITGSPFKFSPSQIRVKKGDTVKITFKNAQGIHDLSIEEFEVQTNQLQAGEEEVVEFVADTTGTFDMYCSVGNHRAQGMEGTLVVE